MFRQPDIQKLLTQSAKEYADYEEESRKFLDKSLHKTYDTNKDGVLDSKECRRLMRESLIGQQEALADHIDALIDRMCSLSALYSDSCELTFFCVVLLYSHV